MAHAYRITYRSWNRTTRQRSGLQISIVTAHTRFGALRTWWRTQRAFQPLVELQSCTPYHVGCPRQALVNDDMHEIGWAYSCKEGE